MYLVVAYYTIDNIYSKCARNFIKSAQKFNIPYMVTPIEHQGNWVKNTQYKATFLKQQLEKLKATSIVYVDIDAEFKESPDLFKSLDESENTLLAAHNLDHRKFGRGDKFELLSGTLFLKNCEQTYKIVENWEIECRNNPKIWDQKALENVLTKQKINYFPLPEEYCTIFDYMREVKNPVIVHYQASREVKNNEAARIVPNDNPVEEEVITKPRKRFENIPAPIQVKKGGITRYHRKYRSQ